MVAVQTTFSNYMRGGVEGQVVSSWTPGGGRETRTVEGTAGIPFGRMVSKGTSHHGAVLGGALVDTLGASIKDITLIASLGQTGDVYQNGNNVGVLNEGNMWVKISANVTEGATATYLPADGTFAPSASGVAIPGSRWMTAGSSGGFAIVRLSRAYHNT